MLGGDALLLSGESASAVSLRRRRPASCCFLNRTLFDECPPPARGSRSARIRQARYARAPDRRPSRLCAASVAVCSLAAS
jgi:hypothetical protein